MRLWIIGVVLILAAVVISTMLSWPSFPTSTVVHSPLQDQGKINVYFCPQEDCEMALTDFLDLAQTSIHLPFMMLV